MPVEIRVKAKFSSSVPGARLRRLAERVLRDQGEASPVTVYIADNAEIRKLNRQFHSTDAVTDVLSFPGWSALHIRDALDRSGDAYLGDVVISYPQARKQARAAGWPIVNELELLTIHGILHLLGYDDLTPRARAKMWKKQSEILGRDIIPTKESV